MKWIMLFSCIFFYRNCNAQAFAGGTITLSVGDIRDISINTNTVAIPDPTEADLDNGYIEINNAITITVDTNTDWDLGLSTTDANLGQLGGHTKPLNDLKWRINGTSGWKNYRQNTRRIQRSRRAANNVQISLDFQLITDWVYGAPGSYSTDVTLTIGAR